MNVDALPLHGDTTVSRKRTKKTAASKTKSGPAPEGRVRIDVHTLHDITLAPASTGRKSNLTLDEWCQPCEDDSGTRYWRCKSTNSNGQRCPTVWPKNCQLVRVYGHVHKCLNWPPEVRDRAAGLLSEVGGTGTKAAQIEARNKEVAGPKTLTECWSNQMRNELEQVGNHAVVEFICCVGLAPYMVDTPAFKLFVARLSSKQYSPMSGTTLTEKFIRGEAASVRALTLAHLKSDAVKLITYSSDGGGTRRRAGFLTIHATDDNRRVHFLTAVDVRGLVHTGELYAKLVLEVRPVTPTLSRCMYQWC